MSQQNLSEGGQGANISLLCQEDSRARMSAMPENGLVSMAAVPLWFMNKSGYLKISVQIMQYLRMSLDSAEGDLKKCSEKLPRSGMMRNGTLYELPDLEHPINEKGSSSLPTPLGASMNPAAHGQVNGEWKTKINRMLSLLPTPTCRDYKGGTIARIQQGNPKRALDCEMQCYGLKLQPAFVEWMQGFPIGWTVSDALEMPSSRSKSTRSSKQLQKPKEENTDERSAID